MTIMMIMAIATEDFPAANSNSEPSDHGYVATPMQLVGPSS